MIQGSVFYLVSHQCPLLTVVNIVLVGEGEIVQHPSQGNEGWICRNGRQQRAHRDLVLLPSSVFALLLHHAFNDNCFSHLLNHILRDNNYGRVLVGIDEQKGN